MGKQQEKARAMSPAPTATIKVKYHDGASKLGSDIHGAMCDLAASETVVLKKGEKKIIPLGVSMKLPDGYFGLVVPRSSTCINCGIAMGNSVGIIENDYCDKESGEPKAGFGPFRVIDYGPHAQAVLLRYEKGGVDGYGNYSESFESCELLTHRKPDSWEKLLGDLDGATNCEISACCYAGNAEKPCKSCKFNRWNNCVGHIFADIADRIRTLMEER